MTTKTKEIDLYDRSLYINREISWLGFNKRCLEEAMDDTNPVLERVKFLAICYGNMDEFFMIRMPGLLGAEVDRLVNIGPDAYDDEGELISVLNDKVRELIDGYEDCWAHLEEPLAANGISILSVSALDPKQKMWVDDYYQERLHPLLTPLALDISHPFPFISNNSLNVAVKLRREDGEVLYARVKVPVGILPRFVKVPSEGQMKQFVLLENILKDNIGALFPGLEVLGCYKFRITRNADVKVTIDEAVDLMSAVEIALDSRDAGFPVRMVVEDSMPSDLVSVFAKNLKLRDQQVTRASDKGMMLTDLWEIYGINMPSLKYKSFVPAVPQEISESVSMFDVIRQKDWILFHPYETFDTVIRFLRESADDPNVQSIKICLYRLGKNSEIIRQLMRAKEKGKAVSVLMELRAKFDEVNNIALARELEKIGVHVVYGPVNLKVHSKLLQVVRLEKDHLVRYTHMSSGNYNANTAKQYADISFLTANQDIGEDVGELFNALTGYFGPRKYKHLLVAPLTLKSTLIEMIRNEAEVKKAGGKAYIAMKANGLIDSDIIVELYKASMAGVKIDLNIRGLCCLRPGIKGISDNITVTSIVDRFLEHERIYYFHNDGDPKMYMGSSDMMPRNLLARVEILFPVLDKEMMVRIRDDILNITLNDNVKARELKSDGTYVLRKRAGGEKKLRSQEWFLENKGVWHG
ncbi:Polyphosphate kinase [Candidatus Methanomethylophilus alvi Mx1201]|jgi:polyphosphate kinase|uniref:Polyphosphate kinase n=2 Tax=Methanomethylophilus alvi TaxID=1291540 RepID=M9SIZ3_METAX|nr:polyphosphate kinase 1 [Methanomethylophilus alvi]CDF31470.1 polyphosphate kinase 2 [Methanoculleus sp. CAG:1088]AGI85487.1 Polyphosphate kinase [Candidatus Methanomethylophilus alvi Mx1201]AYQ54904.1 polyphosphate kinase [Methanomethylophilus alvi]MCI5973134.1 polyphosphate kinase 1 [Methanomethylophilus alvi]MDD7480092.1 polyphosphate kinase 1 [Methanomethylophilus alvi]